MYQPPLDKKPVMKTKHLHKIPVKKQVWPCMGSIKYDGVYAYQICVPGDYRIFSATGMQYHSLKHIEESAKENLFMLPHCVLIFEVHHETYPVNIISGKCRDESNQAPELYAILHDVIPYRDFIAGSCQIPYKSRNVTASVIQAKHYRHTSEFIIENAEHANELFDIYTSKGAEGIIGRNPEGGWIAGHTKNANLWKKKIELSYDLRVIGVASGKPGTKYENTLGVLRCHFKTFGESDGEECIVECSGMTDEQRNLWWDNRFNNGPDNIIGKIVKVDAMTFSANGLLREPRFKEVREDKNEADF